MKKLGIVLGVAAVATITGCKDPDYVSRRAVAPQDEVKSVETTPAPAQEEPVVAEPAQEDETPHVVTIEERHCTCAPGAKHEKPCECGAPDCQCVVEVKPVEPECTIYIVQRDDTLSKISKKFNVKIAAIYKLNPSIKGDVIKIGQKLKLPGKIEVGEQKAPEAAKPAKKAYQSYNGPTVDYVVKQGDTLGAIAYGNGINIRQLKEMNGLASDIVRVGQKLKIPANGKPAALKTEKAAPAAVAEPLPAVVAEEPLPEVSETVDAPVVEQPAPVESVAAPEAPVAEISTMPYVVQEGDDMTSVSISWGVSAAAIRELNNLGEGDQLVPGQVIKLPADTQL
jgi:LysM repeat protein